MNKQLLHKLLIVGIRELNKPNPDTLKVNNVITLIQLEIGDNCRGGEV